jgi:chorismate synthase
MMSIPSAKAMEIGAGFAAACKAGSSSAVESLTIFTTIDNAKASKLTQWLSSIAGENV